MATLGSGDFGIPCKHRQYGPFAFTLTCPDCRYLRQTSQQSECSQKKKPTKKENQREKQRLRRLNKYGN